MSAITKANSVASPDQKVEIVTEITDQPIEQYTITSDISISENLSLIIPYDTYDSTFDEYCASLIQSSTSDLHSNLNGQSNPKNLKTTIKIADGVTLTNNGNIALGGEFNAGGGNFAYSSNIGGKYSRILLGQGAKIIQTNKDSEFYCMGYVESTDTTSKEDRIEIKDGTFYLPLTLRDFRGGSSMKAIWGTGDNAKTYKCSPFNQWQFYNVQTTLRTYYNGKIKAPASLYALGSHNTTLVNFVGNPSEDESQYMFTLNSEDAYLDATYNKETDISNYDFYGGCDVKSLQMKVYITVDTRVVYFPLTYRHQITLNSIGEKEAVYNIIEQPFKIMTGSSVILNENSTLNLGHGVVYSSFYDQFADGKSTPLFNLIGDKVSGTLYPVKEPGRFIINGKLNVLSSLTGQIIKKEKGSINISQDANVDTQQYYEGYRQEGNTFDTHITWWNVISEKLKIIEEKDMENKKEVVVNAAIARSSHNNDGVPVYDIKFENSSNPITVEGNNQILYLDENEKYKINLANESSRSIKTIYKDNKISEEYNLGEEQAAENDVFVFSTLNDTSAFVDGFDVEVPESIYVGQTDKCVAKIKGEPYKNNGVVDIESMNPDILEVSPDGTIKPFDKK